MPTNPIVEEIVKEFVRKFEHDAKGGGKELWYIFSENEDLESPIYITKWLRLKLNEIYQQGRKDAVDHIIKNGWHNMSVPDAILTIPVDDFKRVLKEALSQESK